MLQWLYKHVSSVSDVCHKCFYLDVSKVALGVAHVVVAIKHVSKVDLVLHVFFYSGVAHVAMTLMASVITVFLA
jgi:hypothetical protein